VSYSAGRSIQGFRQDFSQNNLYANDISLIAGTSQKMQQMLFFCKKKAYELYGVQSLKVWVCGVWSKDETPYC
jgi:hypothetical protein